MRKKWCLPSLAVLEWARSVESLGATDVSDPDASVNQLGAFGTTGKKMAWERMTAKPTKPQSLFFVLQFLFSLGGDRDGRCNRLVFNNSDEINDVGSWL